MTTANDSTCQQRSDAYRLLAACFCEPEREMFIEESLCANLAGLMDGLSIPAGELFRKMDKEMREKEQQELLVEYSALFLGPAEILAQPFGSVYLDREGLVMGDSTMAVKKIHAEAGVKFEEDGLPDHIAVELEFMSFLEGKIAEAEAVGNQEDLADFSAIESRFFHPYLAAWAPKFADLIGKHSKLDYYRALAEALAAFIAAEQQRISRPAPVNP
jgi:TorA maturation chaperone TorD